MGRGGGEKGLDARMDLESKSSSCDTEGPGGQHDLGCVNRHGR